MVHCTPKPCRRCQVRTSVAFFPLVRAHASCARQPPAHVANTTNRHEYNQKRQANQGGTKSARHLAKHFEREARDDQQAVPGSDRRRNRVAEVLPPSIHPQVFQQTVNQADMAISITDGQGNILYVNPAFTRVTGYASEEAVGQNQSIVSNHSMPRDFYRAFGRRSRVASPGAGT
jgi:PAS domain-containing protein